MARRSGLGKGLGALIPTDTSTQIGEGEALRDVPLSAVVPNRYQPRQEFDEDEMAALAASIAELGVLQPLLVRPVEGQDDAFELIAGERRLRAAKRAGLVTVPVIVRTEITDRTSLEQALVENLQRADLNAIEEGEAYQRLIDEFGLTHEETAARVGRSRTAVTNTLRLLQLPAGAKQAIRDGALSAGHGRALLGTPDRALQEELGERAIALGLSVRALEELVRNGGAVAGEPEPAVDPVEPAPEPAPTGPGTVRRPEPAPLRPPGVLELEELLSTYLDTPVKVEVGGRRGKVTVDFADIEDLERIYRLMLGADTAR
jgi:ParB family transcriptional regulator, chromosome partitioning protein